MIKPINPIAKMMLTNRRRKQFVKPKKGKGSYERTSDKKIEKKEYADIEKTKQNT